MNSVLKLLANQLLIAVISILSMLPFVSRDLQPVEYLSTIPFIFVIVTMPLLALSVFTKVQLRQLSNQTRLIGLWIGAIGTALVWTGTIVAHPDGQAALGFIFLGALAVIGGVVGYFLFWFLSTAFSKSK